MEKLENIKGIFFDLGYTLFFPPSGSWTFSELGYRYFPREIMARPDVQEIVEKARIELESDHLLLSLDEEYEQFYRYYSTIAHAVPELRLTEDDLRTVTTDKVYNKKDNYGLFDDTIRTLESLRGRYRLGVISDTWPSIVPLLEYFDIRKYFDCVTYSFEVGALKPDPRLYRDALGKMGLPAANTVFIDDRACNLEGAKAAGINTIFIHAVPGAGPAEGFTCIDRISGLLDLL